LQVLQASQIEGNVFGSGPELYVSNLRQADRGRLVHFHGRYEPSELPKLLSQVDVIVVPSIWEDCAPLVVAEALTARCPVIGSRIGGIPEFIEDGVNGFLFDPRDSAGLASVLYQFISNSSLLGRMQRTIQPPRGFNTYLDELISHYREVIAIHRQQVKEQICSFPENEHPVVVWEGSQFVHHSLALINRELCLQLIDRGYEVSIIPYEIDQFGPEADPRFQKLAARVRASLSRPVDVHVRHQWPPNFTPPSEGHWVMIQPWEFGSLPKQWVEVMSTQVDEIWVPSNYVRECYIRSGIPADRVYVVPNGVDTDTFRPDVPPLELKTKKRFKFLFVGGTIFRKGIDILLDTYTNTFTSDDDVCLVIKDMCVHSFYKGQTFTEKIRQIQGNPKAPEILYITEDMEPGCLPSLYTACDCLVHPYRGEGFGLPIVEAMACGLPVIVTAHGAASDFCTKKNAYLIPAQEIRFSQKCVGDMETVDYPWLAEPDSAALKRLMLHVVTKPAENRTKGQIARACIQAHFTWKQAGEAAQKRIETLRRQQIRRFAAKTFLTADRTLISQTGSRAQGKRILIIDPFLPMYDRASGSRYLFESLKIMTSMGHAVTFIARNGQNQERYADELRQMGIEVHATDPDKLRELGHEVQASPIDLQRLLMEKQYDVAILSFYEIAEQYLEDIQRFSPGTRIYIDTHDVHFLREQRQAELYRNRKLSLKAAETKRRELAIYRKADALIARSEEDRRHLLAEIPDATIYVVHNIHDIATNVPPWAERKGLLFVGNFWHPPNADAVLYFCEEILPQIRAEIPDVTFTIVGNSPPPKVQALAGDGIVVTGYVPQIEPYLRSCRVSVAPLRYGAGLKGKVGEALAAGLPVVTTSIGVEGMELPADQQVLLVADDAQAFAETVVQVYRNEALWQALSEAGRNYVKTHYSPQVVAKEIENMLTDHTFQSRHSLFTSIIILNHNGLVHLKKCLASIEAHTPEPHEIIIVDNGSTDDTLDYLRDYSVRHDNVRVIVNASNRGF
ncbi:MAG: glycosyltransferase, partial [candidate division KSB1 bacterium]|nr:glycosyltransferase [candidate division KSB1 bacterium]